MLNFLLNKGGAGVSLSRQDTIERLNPLIQAHYALFHAYNYVIENASSPEAAAQLERYQKITRVDIGKLAETVLSAGGVPYNGTDMEPSDVDLGPDATEMLFALLDREQAFQKALTAEFDIRPRHQIRTLAILQNLQTHSQERLNYLEGLTRPLHRRTEPAR